MTDELLARLRAERYTPIPPSRTKQQQAEDALEAMIRALAHALEDDRRTAA